MANKQWRVATLFLAPYLLIFIIFRFIPSVGGLGVSFFKWTLGGEPSFSGLKNYSALIHDHYFYVSLWNTLLFFILTVPALVIFSLALAMLLNQKLPGRRVARTVSIVPYVLIPSIVGIMWNWIYDNNFGLLNFYLKHLGLPAVHWLTDDRWALVSVAIVVVWTYVGYDFVLFLAGLQGINEELYEAAAIDGASGWKRFWYVTLPLLKPVTMMVITLTFVNVVQLFDQIYVMTNGGPGTSTLTMVQYMYTSAFTNYNLGYGSTIEVAILLILMGIIIIQNVVASGSRRKEFRA